MVERVYRLDKLKEIILRKKKLIFVGSKTSTVIPFDELSSMSTQEIDLAALDKKIFIKDGLLNIQGGVSWEDAHFYCASTEYEILSSPTEEIACVLSGLATSATGERSFGFGTLRDQVEEVTMMNSLGEFVVLKSDVLLENSSYFSSSEAKDLLKSYQKSFTPYEAFKNGPFPRMKYETDLALGTEGQLGPIVGVKLKLGKRERYRYLFLSLPRWEESADAHLEVLKGVQPFRKEITSCEFLDWNSLCFLPEESRPVKNRDIILLEVFSNRFDFIYENLLSTFSHIKEEQIFEINASNVHSIRLEIPRHVNETNAKNRVTKRGTDAQFPFYNFIDSIELYRKWSKEGFNYLLFGHFGDNHLHFNFLGQDDELEKIDENLLDLYELVKKCKGSPFAEHGIGTIKQKFISSFHGKIQKEMFKYLKGYFDPEYHFFPEGFMNKENSIES